MPNDIGGNQFNSNPWLSSSINNTNNLVPTAPKTYGDYKSMLDRGENPFTGFSWPTEPYVNNPSFVSDPRIQLFRDDPRAAYYANQAGVMPPPRSNPGTAVSRGVDEYGRQITEFGVGAYFGDFSNSAPGANAVPDPVYHGPDYRFGDHPDPTQRPAGVGAPLVATPNPAGHPMLGPSGSPVGMNQPTPTNTIPTGQQTTQPVRSVANATAAPPTTTWNLDPLTPTPNEPGHAMLGPSGTPLVSPQTPIPSPQVTGTPLVPETPVFRGPGSGGGVTPGTGPGAVTGTPATPLAPGPSEPRLTPGDADSQFYIVSPQDPQMQQNFFSWLKTNIGAGATPYGEDLNASRDPLLKALYNFYSTGQGDTPAAKAIMQIMNNPRATVPDIINQMAESGLPVDRTQAWQAMVSAQQRNIDRTAADLRGQFAFSGNLAGTPFANAMVDFYTQAAKDQNATLAQWQAQALEAARGRQMTAGELILNASERGQDRLTSLGEFMSNAGRDLGAMFQGMSQADIDRTLNEFIRTRPEYSPLLNLLFSASTTFPPTLQKRTGLGIGGALLSSLPSLLSKIPDLLKKLPTGGNVPAKTGDPKVDSKQPIDVKLSWILPTIAQLMESGMNRPLVTGLMQDIADLFGEDVRTSIETKLNFGGGYLDLTMEDIDTVMNDLWNTDYGGGGTGGGDYDKWWEWFMDNYWQEMG